MKKVDATAELRATIINLACQNVHPIEIAGRLGVSHGAVRSLISRARIAGQNIPRFNAGRPAGHTYIRAELVDLLAPDARSRGLSPRQLAERLIETIARDQMVNAILDDGA